MTERSWHVGTEYRLGEQGSFWVVTAAVGGGDLYALRPDEARQYAAALNAAGRCSGGETMTSTVTSAALATLPLRIELDHRAQLVDESSIRMVSAASIYLLPRGKDKPVLLLGPVGVPGNPDASWPELLRCIADAIELEAATPTDAGAAGA